jgi:signal transduction histidine kinase
VALRYIGGVRGPRWQGITWLTLVSTAAVVIINLAGIWEIAEARKGLEEGAQRVLSLETAARARAIESRLAQARADLAFMTGSPVFFDLEEALRSGNPTLARWRRLEAEGALLLFLRAHPEIMRAVVRSPEGRPLLEAARRGGVPVLWMSAGETPTSLERRLADPIERPVEGRFEPRLGTRTVEGAVTAEVTIDAARVLSRDVAGAGRACALRDGDGRVLAAEPGVAAEPGGPAGPAAGPEGSAGGAPGSSGFEVPVGSEGWSAPAPWTLSCVQTGASPLSLVQPMSARYRLTLGLNLVVMSLAFVLGGFAIHQARVRQTMEATARQETRVRELERQLFHAERLGTVGRLAAGMAHEINNPLEGMSNYLALAREDLARGDAAGAGRRLDGLEEGLRRTSAVVTQVLAHADPARAPLAPVDLAAVLRQTAEFVGSRPEFRNIRFDLEIEPRLPEVPGRQALLGQVFLNLVLNACEAQPQGGEVRIGARSSGARVAVEIADRGPGIPDSEAARIFEPFYSTKQSTGLGLSICYGIVTQHGGDLSVTPRPGGGALFLIDLPVAPAGTGAVMGTGETAPRPVRGGRRV